MSEFSTPAGWYPDGDGWERRWDGSQWSQERRRVAEPTQVRPATPPPSGPPASAPTALPAQGHPQGQGGAPQGPPQGSPYQAPQGGPGYAAPQSYGHVPSTGIGSPPSPPVAPAPAQGGYGFAGGGNFGGYQPNTPPKSSKLWLWITLAVVLILGVGATVTLAVVKPWKDDGSTSTKGKDGDGDTGKRAIQGDINGDGLGDAEYYLSFDYDTEKRVTATSNGKVFELSEVAVDRSDEPNELNFDWDGDGINEPLTWKFVESGKQITLSSNDRDFPEVQNFTISVATLKEYGGLDVKMSSGDFDGDGDIDLVIASPNDRVVDLSVLANDGKGTFSAPVLWASLPNTTIDATQILPGDYDKDGDTDLWAQLPAARLTDENYTGYFYGDSGFALLKSDGKNFAAGAVNKFSDPLSYLLVGDVVGDGTTNILGVYANSYDEQIKITVYDASTGVLKPVAGFVGTSNIGDRSLQGVTLSDVDGDGDGDIVFVVKNYDEAKFTGVQVMKSTGAVFEKALVWADTPACPDDKCRIEFVGD